MCSGVCMFLVFLAVMICTPVLLAMSIVLWLERRPISSHVWGCGDVAAYNRKGETMILDPKIARRVMARIQKRDMADKPILQFATRTDVQVWARSGIAGELSEQQAVDFAHVLIEDAHKLGFRYGDDWAPLIDEMSDREFCSYVDAALQSRKSAR